MRTVFNNPMLCHVWAQQNQPHGRSGSMRFEGSVLFSYRTAIANIKAAPSGTRYALVTSETFSMTTSSKHMPNVRHALRGLLDSFTVPYLFVYPGADATGHDINCAYYLDAYKAKAARMLKCPADSYRLRDRNATDADQAYGDGLPLEGLPTHAHSTLKGYADALHKYQTAFGLELTPVDWVSDANAAIARRDRILNDPKRAAEEAARNAERIPLWLANAPESQGYWRLSDAAGGVMLRINGDTVQTSHGASVPLEHVRRAMRVWRLAVDANALPWRRGDYAQQDADTVVGHFRLDSIDAAGNVRAGCHTFYRAELERFETVLAGVQS